MEGKKQQTAAAMAGMSERSAEVAVWPVALGDQAGAPVAHPARVPLDGVSCPCSGSGQREWLEERFPGRFSASQLRTLQRRLQDWRALNGPDQEVYFPQEHPPGREAQLDFTCNSLGVTIGGRRYRHCSTGVEPLRRGGCRRVRPATAERALGTGRAPQVIRSDNSSALTRSAAVAGP